MTHRVFESNTKKCSSCGHQIKSWEDCCPRCGMQHVKAEKEKKIDDELVS